MRIDYFSLMRKWYVALYRYGLRLTYDVTIPEPGAAMREVYKQLEILQDQVAQGLQFTLTPDKITAAGLPDLITRYPASVPPVPPQTITLNIPDHVMDNLQDTLHTHYEAVTFTVNDGYAIDGSSSTQTVNYAYDSNQKYGIDDKELECLEDNLSIQDAFNMLHKETPLQTYTSTLTKLDGLEGSLQVTYRHNGIAAATMRLNIVANLTPQGLANWQNQVWTALYNAAQTAYYTQQQLVTSQIAALQNKINSVDTLTLRREENDEIMKGVLRWLLGPGFEFMPQSVIDLFTAVNNAVAYGVNFTGNDVGSQSLNWNLLYQNEDRINFINQAIDWDNVVYFLYSYFWDVPQSWEFIRQIQHSDSTRQAFLRAGSARVVLTVRKGWEVAWTWFVQTYSTILPDPLPQSPYLTIAQQIAEYDNTTYPGIPPANPNGGGPIDDDTPQLGTVCTSPKTLKASTSPVLIPVADNSGFVVGATAIIDNFDAGIDSSTGQGPGGLVGVGAQETQTITAVSVLPSTPSITVEGLQYDHPVANPPFPVVQGSAKGVLIAEWFEYTPTSGTDIAVTSDLKTIA
jgi:hypothetical protein